MTLIQSPNQAEKFISSANSKMFKISKIWFTCKLIQKFLSLKIESTLRYGHSSISYLRPVVGSIKNV